MKYKVGDRVRIKSLDWYNKNKDNLSFYTDSMALCFANEIVTIKSYGRYPNTYRIDEDEGDFLWTDEMIEGLVEEEKKPNIIEEAKTYWDSIKDAWICPEGYIFKDENGNVVNATKIVLEKKKKEYPKTYVECSDILSVYTDPDIDGYKGELLWIFQKLLICRDAYLKVAGKEVGLNKPWEPDWSIYKHKFCLGTDKDKVIKECVTTGNRILAFPTRKMRDEFYENFKEEIEICKELL